MGIKKRITCVGRKDSENHVERNGPDEECKQLFWNCGWKVVQIEMVKAEGMGGRLRDKEMA